MSMYGKTFFYFLGKMFLCWLLSQDPHKKTEDPIESENDSIIGELKAPNLAI